MKKFEWRYLNTTEINQIDVKAILPFWLLYAIYGDNLKVLECIEDGKPIAYFYYYRRTIFKFFQRIQNPLFIPYNEIILTKKDLPSNKAKYNSFIKNITTSLAEFLNHKNKNSIITLTLNPLITDTQTFYWNNFKVIPYYTYQIDLRESIESISRNFSPEKRNLIKKAEKDGLQVVEENNYDVLKTFVTSTFERKNKSFNSKLVAEFIEKVYTNHLLKIYTCVNNNNNKIASIGLLISDKTVYYIFSGFDSKNKHTGSISLLIFHAIKAFREKGFHIFDFEGSMLQDVEKNFREFGGNMVPYYSLNKAPLLLEMVLKIFQRNRF